MLFGGNIKVEKRNRGKMLRKEKEKFHVKMVNNAKLGNNDKKGM
jgi:hypothetical protein